MNRTNQRAEASTPPEAEACAATASIDVRFLTWLRRLSFIEGVSTLVLFGVAMPLKYAAGMPRAVSIVGSLHGFLFVGLVLMFVVGARKIPLSGRTALLGVLCAVVPFGPFFMDKRLAELG